MDHDSTLRLQPAKLLGHQVVRRSGHLADQVLVCWERLDVDSATWEDKSVLAQWFPAWNPANKVLLTEGSIVVNPQKATSASEKCVEIVDLVEESRETWAPRRSTR